MRLILSSTLLLAVILLGACSSEEDNPVNEAIAKGGTISATVLGVGMDTDNATAVRDGDNLVISAIDEDIDGSSQWADIYLSITLLGVNSTGTYEIGEDFASTTFLANAWASVSPSDGGISSSGPAGGFDGSKITISKFTDSEIEGTFNFESTIVIGPEPPINEDRRIPVTNGSFSIRY